jgi:hypothetical protein
MDVICRKLLICHNVSDDLSQSVTVRAGWKMSKAESQRLFERVLELWKHAINVMNGDVQQSHSESRNRNECATDGQMLDDLSHLGLDLQPFAQLVLIQDVDYKGKPAYSTITDVGYAETRADVLVYFHLSEELLRHFEHTLKQLWNEAIGRRSRKTRLKLPSDKKGDELDAAVIDLKQRIRGYLRSNTPSDKVKDAPPRYVIVYEGDHFTAKFVGHSKSIKLDGGSLKLMKLIVKEYGKHTSAPEGPNAKISVSECQRAFHAEHHVLVTYQDVAVHFGDLSGKTMDRKAATDDSLHATFLGKGLQPQYAKE